MYYIWSKTLFCKKLAVKDTAAIPNPKEIGCNNFNLRSS